MHPFLFFLAALAGGVALSVFYQSMLAARSRRTEALAGTFSAVTALVYVVCNIRLYGSGSVADYVSVVQVQMFATAGFVLSTLWLTAILAGRRPWGVLGPFGGAYAVFLIARMLSPSLLYGEVRGLRRFVTPWGEPLAMLDASVGWPGYLYALVFFCGIAASVALVARRVRRDHSGVPTLVGLCALVLTTLNDTLVSAGIVPGVFLAEMGFVAFIAMVGIQAARQAAGSARLATELAQSERKLGAVFNCTYQFIGILDPEGRVLAANRPALEFVRASLDEVRGRPLWKTPWWRDLPGEQRALEQAAARAAEGEFVRYSTRHRAADGSIRTFDFSLTPLKGPRGVESLVAEGRDISDLAEAHARLQKAEAALARSKKELSSILSTATDIIYRLDAEGRITYVNDAVRRYGYDPARLIGTFLIDYVHPDDRGLAAHRLAERRTGTRSTTGLELRLFTSRDEERTLEYSAAALYAQPTFLVNAEGIYEGDTPAEGAFIGTQGIARDITERKQAHEALRASEEKHRFLVEHSLQGIVLYEEAALEYVNARFCEITGRDRHELARLAPTQFGELVHPEDRPRVMERILRYLRGGTVDSGNAYRIVRKDGSVRHVEASAKTISPRGRRMALVTMIDVTDRKRAEEDARASARRYSDLVETLGEGIALVDFDERFSFANPAAEAVFGVPPRGLVGRNLAEFLSAAELERAVRETGHRRAGQTSTYDEEIRRPDGEMRQIEVRASPHRDESGAIIGTLGVFRDITDLRRAEQERARLQEQLQQSQKMEAVGRLAGGVAHDFNNLLQVILGCAEMAIQALETDVRPQQELEQIRDAARRSSELTRQLLAFARKQHVSPRVLDLNESVSGAVKMLRRLIGEDIRLTWKPCADPWLVKIDPSQVDQVLANLAANSRDAIDGVGELEISTENVAVDDSWRQSHPSSRQGPHVMLSVRDTGSGMSAEVLRHIYEPFFTTKETGQGTGLGLATVYGIVNQNGGFIDVRSEPGVGTVFRIFLPRTGEAREAMPSAVHREALGGRESVLVVEDDSRIAALAETALAHLGYEVFVAHTPSEALARAESDLPHLHLLLTDVVMPEMNGRELARRIAELRPSIRVLFMSGYERDVVSRRGMITPGTHFLQKPFSIHELARKIRDVLDERAGARDP